MNPMIKENGKWQVTDWVSAMDFAVRKLQSNDAASTAVLAGSQSTNEEYFLLNKLFKALGCQNIDYRLGQTDFSQSHRLPRVDLTLDEFSDNQQIILIGSNVGHEQPILAHRIRQAWLKNEAKISVFNPKQYLFSFEVLHHYVGTQVAWVKGLGSLARCIAELITDKLDGDLGNWIASQETDENLNNLAKQLLDKENSAVFVIGQISNRHPQAGLIKAITAWIASKTNAKVYEMATGANAAGAEICGMGAQNNVNEILNNDAKSFVIYQAENDDFDNAYLAQIALEDAQSVVLMSSFADENIKQVADVILPIGLASEVSGSYFNNFMENQIFSAAAKLPDDSKPGWRVLRVLANMLDVDGFYYDAIDEVTEEVNQIKIHTGNIATDVVIKNIKTTDLVLFTEPAIYDVDMLSRRSLALQDTVHASTDNLNINSIDAQNLGLENAMTVILKQEIGGNLMQVSLFINIDDKIPAGSIHVDKCIGFRSDILNVTLVVGDSV